MKPIFAATALLVGCSGVFHHAATQTDANAKDPAALFALEETAVNGAAFATVGTIHVSGMISTGGPPGKFDETIDRRTGFTSYTRISGTRRSTLGFDGTGWYAHDGVVATVDLPGLVSDGVTDAYINRDGWWSPADLAMMTYVGARRLDSGDTDVVRVVPRGGSAMEVYLDRATHRIDRVVIDGETGPITELYSQYRQFGPVIAAARSVSLYPNGARTMRMRQSMILRGARPGAAIARPKPRLRAAFTSAPPAVARFKFDGNGTGHIIVNARFGGKRVAVGFDSGGANILFEPVAKALGYKKGRYARLKSIAVGPAVLRDQTIAIVRPPSFAAQHPRPGIVVDGLLGAEFLFGFRTTVDYAARKLIFSPFSAPAPRGVTEPFQSDGHSLYVAGEIDGARGLFRIDTGDDGGLTVYRRFADEHRLFQGTMRKYHAKTFEIGGVTLHAPVVAVDDVDAGSLAMRSVAGNAGVEVLKKFKVTFDYRRRTVTFAPNARRLLKRDKARAELR